MMIFTQRFPARLQHHLETLKEGRHGHSCQIEISLTKAFSSEDRQTVLRKVVSTLDGRHLTTLFDPPTGENIVEWIFTELEQEFGESLVAVSLKETEKNRFFSSRNRLFLG